MSARTEEWPEAVPLEAKNVYVEQSKLGLIAGAFAKAQLEMQNPKFDAANPFFKSKFASLAAVRNAVVPLLAKNGICMAQDLITTEGTIACITLLTHSSGQQMRFGPLVLPIAKADAQGYAAAGTYAKRIALQSVCGVVGDDDDDGNQATGKSANQAYDAPHNPKGEMGKNVAPDAAEKAAISMREILEADVEEDVKCLHVADRHDLLNKDQDLYVAAADRLTAKERSAWKAYRDMAKKKAQAEPSGRRF
jgi:hypothetical protein